MNEILSLTKDKMGFLKARFSVPGERKDVLKILDEYTKSPDLVQSIALNLDLGSLDVIFDIFDAIKSLYQEDLEDGQIPWTIIKIETPISESRSSDSEAESDFLSKNNEYYPVNLINVSNHFVALVLNFDLHYNNDDENPSFEGFFEFRVVPIVYDDLEKFDEDGKISRERAYELVIDSLQFNLEETYAFLDKRASEIIVKETEKSRNFFIYEYLQLQNTAKEIVDVITETDDLDHLVYTFYQIVDIQELTDRYTNDERNKDSLHKESKNSCENEDQKSDMDLTGGYSDEDEDDEEEDWD